MKNYAFLIVGVLWLIVVVVTLGVQESESYFENKSEALEKELAEMRDDLGLALEQLGEAQAKLQDKLQEEALIDQRDLPDGVYTPISTCVVNVENDKELNVRFTGGNFPPLIVVEK